MDRQSRELQLKSAGLAKSDSRGEYDIYRVPSASAGEWSWGNEEGPAYVALGEGGSFEAEWWSNGHRVAWADDKTLGEGYAFARQPDESIARMPLPFKGDANFLGLDPDFF